MRAFAAVLTGAAAPADKNAKRGSSRVHTNSMYTHVPYRVKRNIGRLEAWIEPIDS
jgi:hypothetical protein